MSQSDVLKFLEKNKKSWFTLDYLKNKLKTKAITSNIFRLDKYDEIDKIEIFLDGFKRYLIRYKLKGRKLSFLN